MNETSNYHLNQWAKSDQVRMEDFNADNAKIDAAIKAVDQRVDGLAGSKADASALGALQTAVNAKGNCKIAVGTYTGTGTYGTPTALDFANTLRKAPELLIVRGTSGGADALILLRGMTTTHYTLSTSSSGGGYMDVSWTSTGVSWINTTSAGLQYNASNTVYHYVAIG